MEYTICEPSDYAIPTELLSQADYQIVPFLLYRAASKRQSPLSYELDRILPENVKSELLLSVLGDELENFIFAKNPKAHMEQIARLGLADQNLCADRNKGFCQINGSLSESDSSRAKVFDTFLNRLRNSFAHGRTTKEGDFLILEDQYGRNGKNTDLSARFVIDASTLVELVKHIEAAIRKI